MKNILIISEYFAPNNAVASIRLTKLAKYFKLNAKYNITVISRKIRTEEIIDPVLTEDLRYIDKNIVIGYSGIIRKIIYIERSLGKSLYKNIANKIPGITNKMSLKKKLYNIFLSLVKEYIYPTIEFIATKSYAKKVIKYIRKKDKYFDVVLSSYGPFSTHLIGSEIKKLNPKTMWIADFRDPVIDYMTPKKYIKYYKSFINNVSQKADTITGVSDICVKDFAERRKDKIYIICNGFDRDDIKNINIINNNRKFILTYTGLLYNGKSDLSIIFKVLYELIKENKIDKNNIHINYAGRSESDFIQQVIKYNLSDITQIHGFVDRSYSLQLQLNSHILLLASWNSVGETGVVTGKFLEYLMTNKPIVCSITGNLANSQLKEMITEANNGVVWEEANDEIDYPIIKSYILEQYKHFMKNELLFNSNIDYIEQFNYKNITQKFIDLIEKNTENKNTNE